MKILVDMRLGLLSYGLCTALNSFGHRAFLWNENLKPAFDIFEEVKPEFFMSYYNCYDSLALKKILQSKIDKHIVYNLADYLAFDDLNYKQGTYRDAFACDISYIGAFEPWKTQFIFPIIKAGYKVKIFSSNPWPCAEHVGCAEIPEIPDIYASSKLSLNLSHEPNESFYRILGCGCPMVSNYRDERYIGPQIYSGYADSFLHKVEEALKIPINFAHRSLILEKYTYKNVVQKIGLA